MLNFKDYDIKRNRINLIFVQSIFLCLLYTATILVNCTIDMNVSEFQYLADHMREEDCRKLVAALHFDSFQLPNSLGQAERKVPRDDSCVQQLLHWNLESSKKGRGQSHDIVVRRLKQLGHEDLANWLSKTAFDSLGNDFARSIQDPFKMYEVIHLPYINLSSTSSTTESLRITTNTNHVRIAKQDYPPAPPTADVVTDPTEWTIFDTISWTIVIVLFLLVIVLLVYLTLASPCCKGKRRCDCEKTQDTTSDHQCSCYCPPMPIKQYSPSPSMYDQAMCPAMLAMPSPQPQSSPPPFLPPAPMTYNKAQRHPPPCPCPGPKQSEFNSTSNESYDSPCTTCSLHGPRSSWRTEVSAVYQ